MNNLKRRYMAAAPLVIAAEEAESGGLDLLLPETSELIAGIIAFAIIFFFIWRWVVPTLGETLSKRQEAERSKLEAAENTKQEAEQMASDYREQIAGAKDEATRIVEEARQAAETVRSETIARAQQEAEEIMTRARQEADAETARALAEARGTVANLSIDLAEKVVGRSLDRETQLALVDDYLAELETGS
ncbi:MAG: F0F1 ATP synthase subunit B [bacterium]|nr:F0F1 ATP synthase subunit B [bacterium]MXX65329.1 F0F1 ATP synthase subunit B [Acidimicrobiia bacterium]MCY3579746.1 F0F1 ATP synthase subunit B [bacterium]MDE0643087.1 F0F1 ATP synthase subunit B [bacterium]MYD03474.1 F0F1 ATP synthase subunit B [Acidimicrobiia bacterium]